jgi:F-type H+-transporting ATPase subunit delta
MSVVSGQNSKGVNRRVENSSGIQVSLAGRYAKALFDLAVEKGAIDDVAKSLSTLASALAKSADLRDLTTNPLVSRNDASKVVAALAAAMELDGLTASFLGVLAQNRRLGDMGGMIRAFNSLTASHRGEVTAELTSAHKLSAAQTKAIKAKLKEQLNRDVTINASVDPALLGGLVVKVGSTMIDGSIRTKLNTLATAMKG